MQYILKLKKVDVPEDVNFTRHVKVSIKGDVRIDYDLDEREHTYTIPVEKGEEVRIEYAHEDGHSEGAVTFSAGTEGRDYDGYSIMPDEPAPVEPVAPPVEVEEDKVVMPDPTDILLDGLSRAGL